MTIDEIKARRDAATARIDAAAKAGDADAELRAMDDEDAANADLVVEQGRARKLVGARMVREAKRAAGGRYQVSAFDLASKLPQMDPALLPFGGVLLLRSPKPDAKKKWDAEMGVESGIAAADAAADLVCSSTLNEMSAPGVAEGFRAFWEGPGVTLATVVGMEVLKLGGFQMEAAKRSAR